MKQEQNQKEKKIIILLQILFVLLILTSPFTIAPFAINLFGFDKSHIPYCATAECNPNFCETKKDTTTCEKCTAYDEKGIEVWAGKCTFKNGDTPN